MMRSCKPNVLSSRWQTFARAERPRRLCSSSSTTISSSVLKHESSIAITADNYNTTCSPLLRLRNEKGYSFASSYNNYLNIHSIRSFSSSSQEEKTNSNTPEPPKTKESLEFKAETKQLLDIVTHSLYTDKEVFLRELISNASDALEKLRHLRVANTESSTTKEQDPEIPLEIKIETDEVNGTITISDTGVGLSKQDMIDHLGTIAKSGSKAFMNELAQKHSSESASMDISRGIIGKFGVGFYSAFMVGDKVEVRSKPAYSDQTDATPLVWSSEGVGTFDIAELSDDIRQDRGASIVIHLKPEQLEFADEKKVETVLKKYSNFVNFPILLNGRRLNTVSAIWSEDPKTLSDETYSEFYKYIANAFDEPLDKLHYRADAPLDIKALFFIPSFHSEKYGMGRMEPSVSLYSRKVLIEQNSPNILPDWMRFIKGVVDSEDLPLSVSREKAQDTALIAKLKKALTRKFINHLSTMARKDPGRFKDEFYKEYSFFLKEGVCQDFEFQEPLSKLLHYESSKTLSGEITSLDEYVSRCKPDQRNIYYLCAPSRAMAIQSPYLEAFQKNDVEVIFVYSPIDDFVFSNLTKFQGRQLISAEKGDLDLHEINASEKDEKDEKDSEGKESESSTSLTTKEADEFCAWFQLTLESKVSKCKTTSRLSSSPAVVTDNESGALRRMLRMVDTQDGGNDAMELPKQQVEINPDHPMIKELFEIKDKEPVLAKICAEQIFDNCLIAAGLLDDSRSMLGRLNDILLSVVKSANPK